MTLICARDGYLVDGISTIPKDPSYIHVDGLPIVGCCRLSCRACGFPVSEAAGVTLVSSSAPTKEECMKLLGAKDLASSPLVQRGDPSGRLYVCGCLSLVQRSNQACERYVPWRCYGHAGLTLPTGIDGVHVESQRDLRELVRRGFHGETPPNVPAFDALHGDWLVRLHERIPDEVEVLRSVARECLSDPAPRTRALALHFFLFCWSAAHEGGRAHLIDIYESKRDLFAGVRDELTPIAEDTTLEHTVWRILGPIIAESGRVVALARKATGIGPAAKALAQYDARPKEISRDDLLRAMTDPAFREACADRYGPLDVFLRRAGAFFEGVYEEEQYTDWNGSPVGTGSKTVRDPIAPDPTLPYEELAPLLDMGDFGRSLVARHPATPADVREKLLRERK